MTTVRTKCVKNFIIFFLLIISFASKAQLDTVYMTSGAKLLVKVIDLDMGVMTYVNPDSTAKIKKLTRSSHDVKVIVYSSGIIKLANVKNASPITDNVMFSKGNLDAQKYYRHGGGSFATGTISFLTGGILGLIPAIGCSTTNPKFINLGIPKDAPINNKDYMLGYMAQAKKIKKQKVWKAYGIGVLSAVVVGFVMNQ